MSPFPATFSWGRASRPAGIDTEFPETDAGRENGEQPGMRRMPRPAVKRAAAGPSSMKASDDERAGIAKEALWKQHLEQDCLRDPGLFSGRGDRIYSLFVMTGSEQARTGETGSEEGGSSPAESSDLGGDVCFGDKVRGSDTDRPTASVEPTGEVEDRRGNNGSGGEGEEDGRRPVPGHRPVRTVG